ncbi:glycoside hydrolase family 5 protein [Phellopilus nigrolimitatus]|nr:glycoside hydrolase family 5 protein [Phellopilus nigrolimitatus]
MQLFARFLSCLSLFSGIFAITVAKPSSGFPHGSWLVLEPWMLPAEWVVMGGESCNDCSHAFAEAYPDTVDEIFNKHWSTWFTQKDVNKLSSYGINTVRIPLGYWIVEPLVNRATEFYPRGGIKQLKRGLRQLKAAGISVILDHHALPGVQTPNQSFTGRCTSDVKFYTEKNYHRALVWTAVMTALSHLDPDFGSVFAVEAVNEPIANASQTPGYGDFQRNFVKVVRAVEISLGIINVDDSGRGFDLSYPTQTNILSAIASLLDAALGGSDVGKALADAAPIISEVTTEYGIGDVLGGAAAPLMAPLVTNFMDINWQNNNPANPAEAAVGPQAYDNHLYYSFGGVADANENAYLESICNLDRVQADAALGNKPLWFGEWGLSTQFSATDEFLRKWADAQKRAYSVGAGWIFWNFKVEKSTAAGDLARQWSYFEGVERGYFTKDPAQMHDVHVCDSFITKG